jgi:hypothetical protein
MTSEVHQVSEDEPVPTHRRKYVEDAEQQEEEVIDCTIACLPYNMPSCTAAVKKLSQTQRRQSDPTNNLNLQIRGH